MASTARIDELKKKFDENPRRYFAPLANEFRKSGDIEQAIVICEEFLPAQPGHMSGHIVYGQALFEAGRLPEARTVFETALGLDPENLIALRHLGDIARAEGDTAAARTWYVRVLDADPRNEEIQGLIASVDGGDAHGITLTDDAEATFARPAERAPVTASPEPEPMVAWTPPVIEPVAPEEPAPMLDEIAGHTHPFGVPAVPPPIPQAPPAPVASEASSDLLDGFSLHGFDTDHTAADLPAHRAEGLESTEFAPPAEPVASAELDDSLDSGIPSFNAPSQPVSMLDGLESSGGLPNETHTTNPPTAMMAADTANADDITDPPHETHTNVPPSAMMMTADLVAEDDITDPPHETHTNVPPTAMMMAGGDSASEDDVTDPPHETHTNVPPTLDEPLDLDEGLVLPPQGDPLAQPAPPEPDVPSSADWSTTSARADDDVPSLQATALYPAYGTPSSAPTELPPSVIAAEAELIDAGETPAPSGMSELDTAAAEAPAPFESGEATPSGGMPFVTETMAELYVAQGFHDQALGVYRQLSAANPGDERLRAKVASLTPEPVVEGPNVRDFFARLASRRPGEAAAAAALPSDTDFAPETATYEPEAEAPRSHDDDISAHAIDDVPVAEPAPAFGHPTPSDPTAVAPAIERAAAMRTPAGSIDALFGSRTPGTSEDSAAAALAQAFGGSDAREEAPAITGRPARAATQELSLDSVFRDPASRGPRTSQSFSFDQFFSEGAATSAGESASGTPRNTPQVAPAGEAPAERSADDIAQFNTWLQGLKQR